MALKTLAERLDLELQRQGRTASPSTNSNTAASSATTEPWTCPTCGRTWPHTGWRKHLYHPVYHPTRAEGCEGCYYERIVQPEMLAARQDALGLNLGQYASMSLDEYVPETTAEKAALKAVRAIVSQWRKGLKRSLVLYSPFVEPPKTVRVGAQEARITGCGNGKSHLLISLVRIALELNWPARLIDEPTLLDEIKADYDLRPGETPADIMGVLHYGQVLALDDIGTGMVKAEGPEGRRRFGSQTVNTNDWYQDRMYKLINGCYTAGRAVVITTNLPLEGLRFRLGPRSYSRLELMGPMVLLEGYDRRTL